MNKNQAIGLLHNHMKNENLRRHCYAVGFVMGSIYEYLNENGLLNKGEPKRETWEILGIIHDSDYEMTKDDPEKHTILLLEWLERDYSINLESSDIDSVSLYKAIQTHNTKITKLREPTTQMEWALECCDELTGFIVACALVKDDKKLNSVTIETISKKWKQKAFAKGVIREQIEQCEEKLGIPLVKFWEIALKSMQLNHKKLGL